MLNTLEEARKFFKNDRYATLLSGAVIEEAAAGYSKCSMAITENHQNARGGIMGGAIYTLADFAFAVASHFGTEKDTVSVVGQASFMSASKGTTLIAEASLIKDGRSNCFYDVNITDDLGKLIAKVSFNGVHVG